MNLAIFVHEFTLKVGHSHALIEILENGLSDRYETIYVFCFEHDKNELSGYIQSKKIRYILCPKFFNNPFLIKAIWYQLISIIYYLYFKLKKFEIMSMGSASLFADIFYVQFIHTAWENKYFQLQKFTPISYIYKKVLYKYYQICEIICYRKHKKIITLAKFEKEYLVSKYDLYPEDVEVTYSSVNTNRFDPNQYIIEEVKTILQTQYPILKHINFEQPIALFVGAFERKGIDTVLKTQEINKFQLIIIGRPEGHRKYDLNKENIFYIEKTPTPELFYRIADNFIFPSLYEPFGLVITEAALMGLRIYTNSNKIGAVEILNLCEDIYLQTNEESYTQINLTKIKEDKRLKNYQDRKKIFEQYSWRNAAKAFTSSLNKMGNK